MMMMLLRMRVMRWCRRGRSDNVVDSGLYADVSRRRNNSTHFMKRIVVQETSSGAKHSLLLAFQKITM